ncbi:acyl-CoA N-acyltransferase [Crepidotus variabilis]|uniref:histone acetyltransferase n=1 Tax=Crepidotus variabilis TaxID=179855 RepID=A0A9P6EDF8_9AGAR|nr:acyl-CoA N-acyltransferase [Crepidotus variabilis]
MPATHVVAVSEGQRCIVNKSGEPRDALILQRRPGDYYVHYIGQDKRMDEWTSMDNCTLQEAEFADAEPRNSKQKRTRSINESSASTSSRPTKRNGVSHEQANNSRTRNGEGHENGDTMQSRDVVMTEEEFDLKQHKQLTSQKNFDTIIFDTWKITPWYYSPYPLTESEAEESFSMASPSTQGFPKIPGVSRATPRAHGRTSDLLAGGLQRQHSGENTLWVCHFCFKYMVEGLFWELHKKECKLKRPPGKKVYQRGAHTIWEVDGAKDKLYCQNLALFGKLFIDVKTLYFDCDNFLFYILTDANTSEDHILGFFSKEKISYDDYNLACIMTLPQYQRKGYGMLLIEFSYELSRRAGKVGTPERPLSDLGLRSYLSYWVATLIRFFRRVLSVLPPDVLSIRNENQFPVVSIDQITGDVERLSFKKSRKTKGFDGEHREASVNPEATLCMMPLRDIPDPIFTTQRIFETKPDATGGATIHVKVGCTLADIARATNLRIDDAAFALNECGFLMRRIVEAEAEEGDDTDDDEKSQVDVGRVDDMVVITRSLVEKVAKERNIKRMYLDLSCVVGI